MTRTALCAAFIVFVLPVSVLSQIPLSPAPAVQSALPMPVAAIPPVLATVATLQDWAVACDNSLTCEASSLMPDEDAAPPTDPVSSGNGTMMTVRFTISAPPTPNATMDVMVDRTLTKGAYVLVEGGSATIIHRFDSVDAMQGPFTLDARGMKALSMGKRLVLEDANGLDIATISLGGFRDVLLKAQAAQKGKAAVPAVSRLPLANVPKSPPMEPTPKEIMALRKQAGCTVAKGEWQDKIVAPLDRISTLILLSCGAGAYNFSYVPYVGRIEQGKKSFAIAQFDLAPDWGELGTAMLVNPSWNGPEARLSSFAKGRGLGDCGSAQDWLWTGGRFTLVEAHSMPECRGSIAWPTVFRANIVAPAVAPAPVVVPRK